MKYLSIHIYLYIYLYIFICLISLIYLSIFNHSWKNPADTSAATADRWVATTVTIYYFINLSMYLSISTFPRTPSLSFSLYIYLSTLLHSWKDPVWPAGTSAATAVRSAAAVAAMAAAGARGSGAAAVARSAASACSPPADLEWPRQGNW